MLRSFLTKQINVIIFTISSNSKILKHKIGIVKFKPRASILHIFFLNELQMQWKGINCKQSTRWQHLSRLKASAFFSLQKNFSCYETQQLILGAGTAIWWVTEPH